MTNSNIAVASALNGKASRKPGVLTRLETVDDLEGDLNWTKVKPRNISAAEWDTLVASAANILTALGMDLDTPGTYNTPERFLKAMFDSTSGYEGDANLLTAFPSESPGGAHQAISQIIEGPISFFALCEHHAFPFFGRAHVGYIAQDSIIGISKLTRLVRLFARRFTVQERMGEEIADLLVKVLEPYGVAVHIEATHLCTQMRGVREEQSRTWTSFWRGSYETDADLRREFSDSIWNQHLGG